MTVSLKYKENEKKHYFEIGLIIIAFGVIPFCVFYEISEYIALLLFCVYVVTIGLIEHLEEKKMKKTKKCTPTKWYVHQDGDDLFVTCDLPLVGKIYEGSMDACSGFVDGFKKRLNTEIKACRTCQNPYCSRTLKERQQEEVQVHLQYGWECEDKEKWLSHSGGFEFIKRKRNESHTC